MANTFKIRKSESAPIGISIPLESGDEIIEVKPRRIKAKDVGAVEKQIKELDERYSKGKFGTVDYMIEKTKFNVEFSESVEQKLRELDIKELTQFAKLCGQIAAGEHDEEKKTE